MATVAGCAPTCIMKLMHVCSKSLNVHTAHPAGSRGSFDRSSGPSGRGSRLPAATVAMANMAWPFDISDARKRQLLQQLGLLHALERPTEHTLENLLISARVHCLSKVGGIDAAG